MASFGGGRAAVISAQCRTILKPASMAAKTPMPDQRTVFLFDVDNTLLNNDRVTADLKDYLEKHVGSERQQHYWEFFEQLRTELGYADYLGALQRYRIEYPRDPSLLAVSHFLINYPFANRLYPDSLDALEYVKQWGDAVILSDGDVVFQPLKIEHSGIAESVDRKVLIYIHKEQELKDVEQRFPADHYVLIDDKLRILTAVKKVWGSKVTTVFPRQGHYALDTKLVSSLPPADITIARIGDLMDCSGEHLLAAGKK
jgi:FMN phosphatase YigB (HAD superfamily)